MSNNVYVVTRGEYSDYRIVQIFSDEGDAKKFADTLNAGDPYAHADVEDYTLRGAGYVMSRWAARTTVVSHMGVVLEVMEQTSTDECGDYEGKAATTVSGGRTALEPSEVRTHGDALRVPQAHSDAVAKLRAELMGL